MDRTGWTGQVATRTPPQMWQAIQEVVTAGWSSTVRLALILLVIQSPIDLSTILLILKY
jgi:hypothetical protein